MLFRPSIDQNLVAVHAMLGSWNAEADRFRRVAIAARNGEAPTSVTVAAAEEARDGLMSLLGVTMLFFRLPFLGNWSLSPDLAPLITVLWVLGMATAINYIDGLDGLAAGITAIAAGSFALYSDRLFDQGLLPNASNTTSR